MPTATAEIIVAPERLIPGVNATACPNPTMKASLMVIALFTLRLPFRLRINHKAIPVMKEHHRNRCHANVFCYIVT